MECDIIKKVIDVLMKVIYRGYRTINPHAVTLSSGVGGDILRHKGRFAML